MRSLITPGKVQWCCFIIFSEEDLCRIPHPASASRIETGCASTSPKPPLSTTHSWLWVPSSFRTASGMVGLPRLPLLVADPSFRTLVTYHRIHTHRVYHKTYHTQALYR